MGSMMETVGAVVCGNCAQVGISVGVSCSIPWTELSNCTSSSFSHAKATFLACAACTDTSAFTGAYILCMICANFGNSRMYRYTIPCILCLSLTTSVGSYNDGTNLPTCCKHLYLLLLTIVPVVANKCTCCNCAFKDLQVMVPTAI
jgi:hypothetical protein